MNELIAFLRARLDEDERAALAVVPLGHTHDLGGRRMDQAFTIGRSIPAAEDGRYRDEPDPAAREHFLRHVPSRELARVSAVRKTIDAYIEVQGNLNAAQDERVFLIGKTPKSDWDHSRISVLRDRCWRLEGHRAGLREALMAAACVYSDLAAFEEEWRL